MTIDERGASRPRQANALHPTRSTTWILRRRGGRRGAAVVRSLLLSAAVFTLAAVTGALLAGAAPTSPAEAPGSAAGPARHTESELVFAQSMVYSGTAALTLSVTGIVMVGRRRRFW